MTKIKAIGISFLDAMWFGSYTVLPTIGFLTLIGFLQWNI
tara:strand:+ start:164 stop:283 length:120 start_codon:yes stop_codon:yes gene_type:complete